MWRKTAVILAWLGASYGLLVFAATSWWQVVGCALSLSLAMGGVGFSIQHDGSHGGYSRRGRINRLMAAMLDVIGGSSYVWKWKHNVFHHSHPNVEGLDGDLDGAGLVRMSPAQPRRGFHRFQHLYSWFLYGVMAPKWQLLDDAVNAMVGRVGGREFPKPRGWPLVGLVAGKLGFLLWAIAIPLLFHPLWQVASVFLGVTFVLGLLLSLTFQLAHCVTDVGFPIADASGRLPTDWASHQVRTTANFAPTSRVLTWYLGGLNFQIEHHLFPNICHVHYPAIAPIVQAACREFEVPYSVRTAPAALASHARWLHRVGRMPMAS